MRGLSNFLRFPSGGKRLKAPRNEELYIFLFKTAPAGQLHSALPDCRVTLASYIEGKKLREC